MARPVSAARRGSGRRAEAGSASPLHVRRNRASWNREADEYQREHGSQLNRFDRPSWGVWEIPEAKLQVLGDVRNKDVL
jgi:hypothetical protein